MGYEEVWSVLADLLTELRNEGEAIPANVMNDLRSAKTMIQILKADPTHVENLPRIETYLENVEFCLISVAQERLGAKNMETWMKKLDKARKEIHEEEATSRFVPGIPRGEHWVRVQVTKETLRKDIERLAEENKLSHKIQEDGYILVWGKSKKVKSFIESLREAQNSSKSVSSKA